MRIPSVLFLLFVSALSVSPASEPTSGWRGNGTGLWPEAKVTTEWSRIPHRSTERLWCRGNPSPNEKPGATEVVEKGLIREWLVIGPFGVADSEKNFDDDLLNGESLVEPNVGNNIGDHKWTPLTSPADDPMVFGTADVPWLDVGKAVGFKINQLAYAHTYLFSPRGGPARFVVDHGEGLKAWLNGREVYRQPKRDMALGFYTNLSKIELNHQVAKSPSFAVELKPGWNRLLLKLSSPRIAGHTDMRCHLRIMDPPGVPYETKNIQWIAELPARSTSTPILVGDRIFVAAEPDELLCFDKNTGKRLWSAAVNYYEALTPEQKAAKPEYAARVDPLLTELRRQSHQTSGLNSGEFSDDRVARTELRAKIQKTLLEIDEARFNIPANDHFEAHFGIVGFTMPTPLSDGKNVFVWNGMGVAACFDLDGNRKWITRVETDHIVYGSSPALADGVFVAFFGKLFGFDAEAGNLKWTQHRVNKNVAAVLAAKLAGQDVVITQAGEVVRPNDGHLLFRPRGLTTGDQGWAPPVVLGNTMFSPRYGVNEINVFDFAGCEGVTWQPQHVGQIGTIPEVNRKPDGGWIDRWTAGSPLVWDGLLYQIDIYGNLFVSDIAEKKMIYWRDLKLRGFMHYNSVPVAASPTLIGKHILLCDNQGTTVVIEPGREYREVARNRIDTVIDRQIPLPAQETLTYSPPITDGRRIFLRGERYLYCIGHQ
jgi:hypothetical protein